jgi:L-fuculose-phosphate aldolase
MGESTKLKVCVWPRASRAKVHICDIGRRVWLRGFVAGNDGNISVRIGPDRVLCTPTRISKGILRPADICTVDMNGRQVAGAKPRSSEVLLHLSVFRHRPDVRAVVHTHATHATAFAVANRPLPTGIYPEADYCLGVVPIVPFVIAGDHRLADSIVPYLEHTRALLLANHGALSFDPDLEEAYYLTEMLDAYARIALLTQQLGGGKPLTRGQMAEVLEAKRQAGLRDPRLQGRYASTK